MGGVGSGRPPSAESILNKSKQPVLTPIATEIFIPNYSGLKEGLKKGETNPYLVASDLSPYWKSDGTSTASGNWSLGSYDLTTTGDINIASDSNGLNLGVNGSSTFYGSDDANYGYYNIVTAKNGAALLMQSARTKFRWVADNLNAGYGYFQAGLTGGSNSGKIIFSGINVASLSGFNVVANTTRIGNVTATGGERLQVIGNLWLETDNDKFYLGAGKDASIYYDGTNMIIDPKVVGSGYLSILGDVVSSGNIDAQTFSVNSTAGADASFSILDGDGVTSHDFVFSKGLLTSYGTS